MQTKSGVLTQLQEPQSPKYQFVSLLYAVCLRGPQFALIDPDVEAAIRSELS